MMESMTTDSNGPQLKTEDRQLLKIREMRDILGFDLSTEADGETALKPLKAAPALRSKAIALPIFGKTSSRG